MNDDSVVGMQIQPILPVSDLEAAIQYFCTVLGFENSWKHGEPPIYGGVTLGSAGVHFQYFADYELPKHAPRCYFSVKGVQKLYKRQLAAGGNLVSEPLETGWRTLEYTVITPYGLDITFAERIMGKRKQVRNDLQNVTVTIGKPEPYEFRDLMCSVGWQNSSEAKEPAKYLGEFYGMVIARDGHQLIGCGVIERVRDSVLLISDVCVRPQYQGNGIGKRILAGVDTWLALYKTPDMIVFLFTTHEKMDLYRQFGYLGPESAYSGMYKFPT